MHRSTLLPLAVSAGLALTVLASTAACGGGLVSPLDPDAFPASAPATSPSPLPTTTRPPARRPAPTRAPPSTTLTATPTSACMGPVVLTLPADTRIGSFCIELGGILRVQGTGPDMVFRDPEANASYFYEAGIVELQFIRPGTVTVTIHRDGEIHAITVVVREGGPGSPSPQVSGAPPLR